MNDAELERVRRDGHEGLFECSLCHQKVDFGSALTVWHAGAPFFGLCSTCVNGAVVSIAATDEAFHVRVAR